MAGNSSKRSRSTSTAVGHAADTKRRRSNSGSHDEDEREESAERASSSRVAKLQARRPAQTTKSKHDDSTTGTQEELESAPIASGSISKPSSSSQSNKKTSEKVLRRISGGQDRGLLQEHEDLQARFEETQANYQAIREAYQTLQELRETGPEGTLREAQAHNVGRLEALRKQVSTYAKENEELRNQADALKEEVATLSENQEGANGVALTSRTTAAEREDETMDMSTDNSGTSRRSTSKAEASLRISREDEALLREENEELKAKIQELSQEVTGLTEDAQQLKKEKKSLKKQWEADFERLESNLKQRWEKERQKLLAENEEMVSRSAQLEKELAFEVEQSKKLQALASQTGASNVKSIPNVPAAATTSQSSDNSEELVQLLLDFTGMTLVRRPQEGDKTYNFVMTDFKKRKALNFKLIVDRDNNSVDFIPDLLPGRDDEVIDSMENAIRGHIKFEYELIQTFFKRLWRALNGHR